MRKSAVTRGITPQIIMVALLVCHAGLLGWIGFKNSPNSNEASHLAAGIYNLQVCQFDPYPVNPPLVRMLAAMPVVCVKPLVDWENYSDLKQKSKPGERPEWSMGIGFVRSNRARAQWFFTLARWALIPLSILGGYFCWRWASELYGTLAGLVTLVLWCFSPNVLAWSATICPDAAFRYSPQG